MKLKCWICGKKLEGTEKTFFNGKCNPCYRKARKVNNKVKDYLDRANKVLTGTFKSVEIGDKAPPEFVNHLIEIAKMIQREEHGTISS